jgi:MYXO-CTERM domain-containing protein
MRPTRSCLRAALIVAVALLGRESRAGLDQHIDLTGAPRFLIMQAQSDPRWGSFFVGPVQDQGGKDSQGNDITIGRCGCMLTSMSTAFRAINPSATPWYPHVQLNPLTGSFVAAVTLSPKYIDDYLNYGPKPGSRPEGWGFLPGSGGTSCQAAPDRAAPTGLAKALGGSWTGFTWTAASWDVQKNFVDAALVDGKPSIIIRKTYDANGNLQAGKHANLIVGWDNGTKRYLVYDPMWGPTAIQQFPSARRAGEGFHGADDAAKYTNYMKAIETVYVLEPTSTAPSYLGIEDDPEPIKLRLTDPRGWRTGYDPETGENVQEDRQANFFEETSFTDPLLIVPESPVYRYLLARDPLPGGYGLEVFGIGDGPYKLTLTSIELDQGEDIATVTGDIVDGEIERYEIVRSTSGKLTIEAVAAFTPRARAGNDAAVFLGKPATFDGRGSYQVSGEIAGHAWDFGDGASASGAEQSHTYAAAGTYTATLTVTNLDGLTGTDARTIEVVDPASLPKTETIRVNLTSANAQTGSGSAPRVTPDGRYVVFESTSPDLVAGDTNASLDVFVKDLVTGDLERVSVANDGSEGLGSSYQASISADGRFVVFVSNAQAFFPDGVPVTDYGAFLRDRTLGTTEAIGTNSGSLPPGVFISAGGQHIAMSTTDALVLEDVNGTNDIYVFDRQAGSFELASVDAAGMYLSSYDKTFFLSADGTLLCFTAVGAAGPADTNGAADIVVRDLVAGTTEVVSLSETGEPLATSTLYKALSDDGRFVAFGADDTGVVAGDTNGWHDVFVRDRMLGTTERVSVSSTSEQGNWHSHSAGISSDGRYVAFFSKADNFGPSGTQTWQAYLRDLQTQTTVRVSVDDALAEASPEVGVVQIPSAPPSVTEDGAVVFQSTAANLVAGDTNGATDVFMRRLVPSSGAAKTPLANLGGPYLGWASSASVPAGIQLDGSASVDPQDRALGARWDFGDGSPLVDGDLIITHAYAKPGVYQVSLTVSAGADTSLAITTEVEVMPPLAPASLSADACAAQGGTLTVAGEAIAANAALVAAGWDRSKGALQVEPAAVVLPWGEVTVAARLPGLTFRKDIAVPARTASGSYQVALPGAANAPFAIPCAIVENEQPQAVAGGPVYPARAGRSVTLDGSGSTDAEGAPLTFRWSFGDGTYGEGATPEHVYAAAGNYMVTLIVNDGTQDSPDMVGTRSFAMVAVTADASPEAPPPNLGGLAAEGGCGCSTAPKDAPVGLSAGLALLLLARRRRRPRLAAADR